MPRTGSDSAMSRPAGGDTSMAKTDRSDPGESDFPSVWSMYGAPPPGLDTILQLHNKEPDPKKGAGTPLPLYIVI
jgi:hypothetical protein